MISITPKFLESFIALCKEFHSESRYAHTEFSTQKVVQALHNALANPDRAFVDFYVRDEELIGIFVGSIIPLFFSTQTVGQDLVFYVKPEYRGTSWFVKSFKRFEDWSRDHGASFMSIYHDTGIGTDKAEKMMEKFKYTRTGLCFSKEL